MQTRATLCVVLGLILCLALPGATPGYTSGASSQESDIKRAEAAQGYADTLQRASRQSRKVPLHIPDSFTRVLVKFEDHLKARPLPSGEVVATSPSLRGNQAAMTEVNDIAAQHNVRFVRSSTHPVEKIEALLALAEERSGRAQPDLLGMVYLDGRPEDLVRIAPLLHASPDVDYVFFEQPYVQMGGVGGQMTGPPVGVDPIHVTAAATQLEEAMDDRFQIRDRDPDFGSGKPHPLPRTHVAVNIDSGVVQADPAREPGQPQVVFSRVIGDRDDPWVRLRFTDVQLSGFAQDNTAAFIQITSLKDGAVQILDTASLPKWSNHSAFFNGGAVLVELFAYPGTGPNRIVIDRLIVGLQQQGGLELDICGDTDERDRNDAPNLPDGRMIPVGCTAFLFNDRDHCLLSAGHCLDGWDFEADPVIMEFNVPDSDPDGTINFAAPEDQYPVDEISVQLINITCGNDFTYFGAFENNMTDLTPLEGQGGNSYTLAAFPSSPSGQGIQIRGYGTNALPIPGLDESWNQTLTEHIGPFIYSSGTTLGYRAHTSGGNSGSAVFDTDLGLVIGIHTCGGCNPDGTGFNVGTAINHPAIQFALANPLGVCADIPDFDCVFAPHSCFEAGDPGCDDEACCKIVCDIDPFCCSIGWDEVCVNLAQQNCEEEDIPTPDFSVPRGPGGEVGSWECSSANRAACFQGYLYRFNVGPDNEQLLPFIPWSTFIHGWDLAGLEFLADELVSIGFDGSNMPDGTPKGNMSRGMHVNIGVIDLAFWSAHEDLTNVSIEPGQTMVEISQLTNPDHGTAILGIIAGQEFHEDESGNPYRAGVQGIAQDANVSFYPAVSEEEGGRLINAMQSMLLSLDPGDVALFAIGFPFGQHILPPQMSPPIGNHIEVAFNLGIITVQPAGNGYNCSPATGTGDLLELAGWEDLGSIVVGAGEDGLAPLQCPHGRWFVPGLAPTFASNYFDVNGTATTEGATAQAWGRNVVTAGYGNLFGGANTSRRYTFNFQGTSAAAAQIAGVVARYQGLSKQIYGFPLAPTWQGSPQGPSAFGIREIFRSGAAGAAQPWEPEGTTNSNILQTTFCGACGFNHINDDPAGNGPCFGDPICLPDSFENGINWIGRYPNVVLGLSLILDSIVNLIDDPEVVCTQPDGDCCEFDINNPGCGDDECCAIVFGLNPMCQLQWDELCTELAQENCPVCINCESTESCCEAHGGFGCDDDDCCVAVCSVNPDCCNEEWDSQCAFLAGQLCDECDGSAIVDITTLYGEYVTGDVVSVLFQGDEDFYIVQSKFAPPGTTTPGTELGEIMYLSSGHVTDIEVIADGDLAPSPAILLVTGFAAHDVFTLLAVEVYNHDQNDYQMIDMQELPNVYEPGADPLAFGLGNLIPFIDPETSLITLRLWTVSLGGDTIPPYHMFYDLIQFESATGGPQPF